MISQMVECCLYCGGAPSERFEAREMMFGLRHRFTYLRCVNCASLWLAEPPDDLNAYYGSRYYSMDPDPKGAAPIPRAATWTRVLLQLPPALADRLAGARGFPAYVRWLAGIKGLSLTSRIADVGSGAGDLTFQLSRHGFRDLWGFDPFTSGDRDVANVHLRSSELSSATKMFDLIMFNHSLEHVPDPEAALRTATSRLASGGTIVVRVPLAGSFADREYAANWVALDAPRHLNIPSLAGMRWVADSVGLRISRMFFDSQPLQFWASEQYARDVPLYDARSGCRPEIAKNLARRARRLNAQRDGDTAGFVLHPR